MISNVNLFLISVLNHFFICFNLKFIPKKETYYLIKYNFFEDKIGAYLLNFYF